MCWRCASCDPHSLQQLIDYDTEISQVLLEHPIRSLEGKDNLIGCIVWSHDPLVFDDSINEVELELIEQESDDDHLVG